MEKEKPSKLTPSTLIPIGTMLVIIGAILGGQQWLNSRFNDIDQKLSKLQSESGSRWTSLEMEVFAIQMERDNPNVKVPSVDKIRQNTYR